MDNNIPKGTIKTKIGNTIIINDCNIGSIIKEALQDKGYDLVVRPNIDSVTQFYKGEEIEVFSKNMNSFH